MSQHAYDLSGETDIDFSLTEVTGRRALAQRISRRLTTRKGTLEDDRSYGEDVRMYVGAAVRPNEVKQRVTGQVMAEPDVENASVAVTFLNDALEIAIKLVDAEGEFDLILRANSSDGELTTILVPQ